MPAKDNTALVALIGFVGATVICSALALFFWHEVWAQDTGLEDQLKKLRQERRDIMSKTEEILQKAAEKEVELGKKRRARSICQDDLDRAQVDKEVFRHKGAVAEGFSRSLRDAPRTLVEEFAKIESGDGEGSRRYALEGLEGRKQEEQTKIEEEMRKLQAGLDEVRQMIVRENEVFANEKGQFRRILGEYSTAYHNYKAELEKMTAREEIHVGVDEDGTVIESDLDSRLAVIDLGSQVGVKKGFRFEVFLIEQGNRRVHKGYLEVRSLEPETATCSILVHMVQMPRCPICGYVAHNRFEQYCPYCSGGETGFGLQRLSGSPKLVEVGMDRQNPIVAGDYVYNPFFDRDKRLRFAAKGQAVLPEKFARDYVIDLVRWHGGIVEDDVSARTDYLIAGKWASEDVKKARELGVKVLFQFDLFEFFER